MAESSKKLLRKTPTDKMANKLEEYGYNVEDMTFDRARQLLDAIAKNDWKPLDTDPEPVKNGDDIAF